MKKIPKFKKILLVMPDYSSFKYYLDTFDELGIENKLFNYRHTSFFEKVVFGSSFINKSLYKYGQKLINLRLLSTVEKYKPDLVLVIKGENILPETVLRIRKLTRVANYFSDYMRWFSEDQMTAWLKAYEVVFTGDKLDVDTYRKKGFLNLYHVHMPSPPVTDIPKKKKYDVVFVGAYSKEREEIFKRLKDLNFKIWGDKKWRTSSLKNNHINKRLSNEENLEVFKNSKIVVNFHNDLTGKNRYINLRVFEAAACQTLLISDLRKDLPTVFKIGQEIVIYKNSDDLYKKVIFYLSHKSEREKIALNGRRRVLKDHTYQLRLKQMFSLIP